MVRQMLDRWTVLTLIGVGGFMLWGAGHYTVFDDEAFSCRRYAMPIDDMVTALWHGVEPDPPLYYIIENLWVHAFGVGPPALRIPSILLFLAGLIFIRLAGQTWFDRTTGIVAMLLCAVHPAHLFFGFAARWYSLMFALAALLLALTGRMAGPLPVSRSLANGWAFAAAGLCYTNFFGPVVAGFTWCVGVWRSRRRPDVIRRWIRAAVGLLILWAPWMPAFVRQVIAFDAPSEGWRSVAATLARTVMALLAGNLASIGAWWVWAPLAVCTLSLIVLLLNQWRGVRAVATVALGCLVVGVLSRTMIDKYVMVFSGIVGVLAAALIVRGLRVPQFVDIRVAARAAVLGLVVGWIGCGVNLVRQQGWSSLRWLDPFKQVMEDLATHDEPLEPSRWVMTHPSARYYFGLRYAKMGAEERAGPSWRVDPQTWRRLADLPSKDLRNLDVACATPNSMLEQMETAPVPWLLTIETTGYQELADNWGELYGVLARSFSATQTRQYLQDPDARWKDRLDPAVAHPSWRIVVRRWDVIPRD